ncbi:hypothetical protein [Alkaliphilus sp. B6464]|uniref:hypothetical protein n=1 Tax=Alkaliphilus sp. B6464 TaxID=2731219 RepID=UPI001BA97137|nr:hypothetical protein [Alkaliphilus sp. B6464]QUH18437.1 hypothetical protein HYG84_16215 [Alkaliphilus sp. B6464]
MATMNQVSLKIASFINLFHQKEDNKNITIIVLDNRTGAMTGGQHNGSSGL